MHFYNHLKGALTKMVNALKPQKKEKSMLVSRKYDSSLTLAKRRKLLQGKSVLCTTKYYQSDGVDVDEDEAEAEENCEEAE